MAAKKRADQLAFELGLAESREKAKRLIMAGQVLRLENGRSAPVDKPGTALPADAELILKQAERFVSRGGHKLLTAIEHFGLTIQGKTALDAGASTGGFTDCLLQHGAAHVYAADVGRGLLHEKLLKDPRVTSLEKINLRHAPPDLIPVKVDLVTVDVSFISLAKVLPALVVFLKSSGEVVTLVKPQFELGPGATDKGVVRDESLRMQAVRMVEGFAAEELGLKPMGHVPSRIKGPKGNQEYLAYFRKGG